MSKHQQIRQAYNEFEAKAEAVRQRSIQAMQQIMEQSLATKANSEWAFSLAGIMTASYDVASKANDLEETYEHGNNPLAGRCPLVLDVVKGLRELAKLGDNLAELRR